MIKIITYEELVNTKRKPRVGRFYIIWFYGGHQDINLKIKGKKFLRQDSLGNITSNWENSND